MSSIYGLVAEAYLDNDSRHVPLNSPPFKPGTWFVDDEFIGIFGRRIEELVWLDPRSVVPSEFSWDDPESDLRWEGRLKDAERYAEWLKRGLRPLPITIIETSTGELRATDGHRRLYAHDVAGLPIPARVSWLATVHPPGFSRPTMTGLTYEIANRLPLPDGAA